MSSAARHQQSRTREGRSHSRAPVATVRAAETRSSRSASHLQMLRVHTVCFAALLTLRHSARLSDRTMQPVAVNDRRLSRVAYRTIKVPPTGRSVPTKRMISPPDVDMGPAGDGIWSMNDSSLQCMPWAQRGSRDSACGCRQNDSCELRLALTSCHWSQAQRPWQSHLCTAAGCQRRTQRRQT